MRLFLKTLFAFNSMPKTVLILKETLAVYQRMKSDALENEANGELSCWLVSIASRYLSRSRPVIKRVLFVSENWPLP